MSRVIVTGGSGFVGSAVLSKLNDLSHQPVSVFRGSKHSKSLYEEVLIDGLHAHTEWGLCRARHKPHYADSWTMPSDYQIPKSSTKLEPSYSA